MFHRERGKDKNNDKNDRNIKVISVIGIVNELEGKGLKSKGLAPC
jgi:hypothetical protein